MTSLTCLAEKREGGKEEQLSFAAELQTSHFSNMQTLKQMRKADSGELKQVCWTPVSLRQYPTHMVKA